MRDLMREGVEEGKGVHMVNWEIVGKSIHLGELELENLKLVIRRYW